MNRKLPLAIRLSMITSYIKYRFFLDKKESLFICIEFFFFIPSIFLFFQDIFSNTIRHTVSFFFLYIVFQFLWETYNKQVEINEYLQVQPSILRTPPHIETLVPSPKEKTMNFEVRVVDEKSKERVFVSHRLNRYIQTTPLTIILSDKKKKKIDAYMQKHKEVLLQYLNYFFFSSLKNNRQFTNEKKFCMSHDISLNSHSVVCHTGGYYDSFLTNQITGTTLVVKDKKHTTISTEEIFPVDRDEENNMYVRDISSAPMNHHVGCSTLGITKDNKILIWFQGENNQIGQGLLAPTGSGSANASDIRGTYFQKTIIRAMERELQEESIAKKKKHTILPYQTMILGFYRWISRGGKPEFVGITRLSENAEFYTPNTQEVGIKNNTNHIFSVPDIDSLPHTISQIRKAGKLSVPLFMCLEELEYMYTHHKNELEDFIFGSKM